MESEIRRFLARIHCTTEEKIDSIVCIRNVEMYEIAYKQAVKDYEKAQKPVNALEEEAVKALTGESRLDLKIVNAMLLKHREKLEAAQLKMEQIQNRMEQDEQNKKATKAQIDELRTWGEIYDRVNDEIRHMITWIIRCYTRSCGTKRKKEYNGYPCDHFNKKMNNLPNVQSA